MIAERAGVPAVAVMTENFVSAADLMGRVLGLPDYPYSVIQHPVSSADDDALKARAARTMADIERLLLT